jgi:hypothetical protein
MIECSGKFWVMGSNHDFLKHSALKPLFNQKKRPSVQAIFKEYFVD